MQDADGRDQATDGTQPVDGGLMILAIGGNAISRHPATDSAAEQRATLHEMWTALLPLLTSSRPIVVVHGNGPQVGMLLLAIEAGDQQRLLGMTDAVAATQGTVGYLLVDTLTEALRPAGSTRPVTAILTRSLVDADDPSFQAPTKFVGPFYSKEVADRLTRVKGWTLVEDSGRGFRRVVASPRPLRILEAEAIGQIAAMGHVVVGIGGGGIPVAREPNGRLAGMSAVVDKDLAAARLGVTLGAEALVLLTSVEHVATGFGTPRQRKLGDVTLAEAEALYARGEFPPGSMGPKIEAALEFVRGGGRQVVVTLPERAAAALRGEAGTRIRG